MLNNRNHYAICMIPNEWMSVSLESLVFDVMDYYCVCACENKYQVGSKYRLDGILCATRCTNSGGSLLLWKTRIFTKWLLMIFLIRLKAFSLQLFSKCQLSESTHWCILIASKQLIFSLILSLSLYKTIHPTSYSFVKHSWFWFDSEGYCCCWINCIPESSQSLSCERKFLTHSLI